MYKVLVVDDEPIIVDGLYELFRELKSYPLDVYKAYSGMEALDWLAKKRIDVVVTDIKMPEIDGLQLLENIHGNWPGCKVVFLTGHDSFEYVYEAIRHEGVKYLLKTESYERIVQEVEQLLEQIGRSMRNEELLRQAREQMLKATPVLRKEYLLEAIEGERAVVEQPRLDELHIPLRADKDVLLIAGAIGETEGEAEAIGKPDLYAVDYAVEQQLGPFALVAGVTYRHYMLWLLQPQEEPGAPMLSGEHFVYRTRGALEAAQAICRETLKLPVSFALSGKAVQWHDIAESFSALKAMLNYCSLSGMEAVLVAGADAGEEAGMRLNMNRMANHVHLQLKKLEALEIYLEQGRKESFLHTFREIREALAEQADHAPLSYEVFYSLSLLFISYMNRYGIAAAEHKPDYDRLTQYGRFGSLAEALDYLEAVAIHLFELQNQEQNKRSAVAVQRIQQYIRLHPEGDLSLSSLADLVYFNPKYLSRLFKQETGMNLSDYISDVKLNLAKKLIRQNTMKIHEIAEHVGYYSAPYFTRFFKKATGMSPQEYRDAAHQAQADAK